MKAIVCSKPHSFEYKEIDRPRSRKGHAIIKIKRIGICGTDLHAFEGTQPFFSYPRILGHELAGELVEFDSLEGFNIGDKVTFVPYFPCFECIACKMGHVNCCMNIQGAGVHIDGGMAEYIIVPEYAIVDGKGLSFDEIALIEPFSISAHAVNRAEIRQDEFVLVSGAGPIGLAAMELAAAKGAIVIAMDVVEQKLDFCKNTLKINHVINALNNADEKLKEITNGNGPTVIIDATGNKKSILSCFSRLAHGGRIIMVGIQRDEICFNHPEFHKRETILMSSRNAFKSDFEDVINLMRAKKLNALSYITHRATFDTMVDEFPKWLNPGSGIIKAMVEMEA